MGGGPGGYVAAIKAAQLGLKVSRQSIPSFSTIEIFRRGNSQQWDALKCVS